VSDFDLVIDNATYIVTSDSKNRVLKDCAIAITDKKIVAKGPRPMMLKIN